MLLRPQDESAAASGRRQARLDERHPPRSKHRSRQGAPIVGWDKKFGLVKISPLANWTKKDVWNRILAQDIPYNPLHDQGYPSIGCWPCTRAVGAAKTNARAVGAAPPKPSAACTPSKAAAAAFNRAARGSHFGRPGVNALGAMPTALRGHVNDEVAQDSCPPRAVGMAPGFDGSCCACHSRSPARACTTFVLEHEDQVLFGRNYDWHLDTGLVVVNKRGVAKKAFSFEKPIAWESRYGSVTFNQYGREFPNDGLNEAGLAVAVMWLDTTKYPSTDERQTITSAQWVQYQLDTAKSVEDVIASDDKLRITHLAGAGSLPGGRRHRAAAVIEFLDGKMVVHTGKKLEAKVLANNTCDDLQGYLHRFRGFGGGDEPHGTSSSFDRYVTGADASRRVAAGELPATAETVLETLGKAAQGNFTKWSIAYDLANKRITYRTHRQPEIKTIAFDELDFDSATPVQVIDINTSETGNLVPHLQTYTTALNRALIDQAFDATWFLKPFPALIRQQIAEYPEKYAFP